jgi:Ca2+-binding RTX toxin-like protein
MAIEAWYSFGQLDVTGNDAGNTIDVSTNSLGNLSINNGSVHLSPFFFPIGADYATGIRVMGNGGSDMLSVNNLRFENPIHGDPIIELIGGTGHDRLTGSSLRDILDGGSGNDIIDGNQGNDEAVMGSGNDQFIWNSGDGNDYIDGGNDFDTVIFNGSFADETYTLSANNGRLNLARTLNNVLLDIDAVEQVEIRLINGRNNITIQDLASTDVEQVNLRLAGSSNPSAGDGSQDTITMHGSGNGERVQVSGSASETMVSGLAATVKLFNTDGDRLSFNLGAGDDVLDARTALAVTADGGTSQDTLRGGSNNDTLMGGAGNDLIAGDLGNDVLTGNAGRDSFRFNATNEGIDTIQDFSAAEDMIQIRASAFGGGLTAGTLLSASQFHLGSAAQDSNDRFIFDGRNLFFDADGSGRTAQIHLATFSNNPSLSAANIRMV